MFVAKIKDNPATCKLNVDGIVANLARLNVLKLCTGNNSDLDLEPT